MFKGSAMLSRLFYPICAVFAAVNSTIAAAADATVELHWQAIQGAHLYEIVEVTGTQQTFVSDATTNSKTLRGITPGQHTYQVRACVTHHLTQAKVCGDEISNFSQPITVTAVSDNRLSADWADLTPVSNVNNGQGRSVAKPTTENVGTLAGQPGVSGGQASYGIPIRIAPGRNNVQPEVSINYSSSAGNGVVGVGFGLSAGGSITRCSSTMAQDGRTRSVQYDNEDKLCLNGQRLVVLDTYAYGQANAQYRTEIESYVKVTQHGALGEPDTYFSAVYPDGSERQFGINSTSRVQPVANSNATLVTSQWLLNKYSDVSGNNTISYNYQTYGAGETLIKEITYTGDTNSTGNRKLVFDYENRSDTRSSYQAGYLTQQTKRLKKIISRVGSTDYWTHELQYDYSRHSQRSLLSSVTLKDKQANALPETRFTWSDERATYALETLAYIDGAVASPIQDDINAISPYRISNVLPRGDTNGDGVRDWKGAYVNAEGQKIADNPVELDNCLLNRNTRTFKCLEADFDRNGITDDWDISSDKLQLKLNYHDGTYQNKSTHVELTSRNIAPSSTYIADVADYNGDGWPDLMVHAVEGQNVVLRYYEHTGNVDNAYPTVANSDIVFTYDTYPSGDLYNKRIDIMFAGDLDGDGLPDLVEVDAYDGLRNLSIPTPVPQTMLLSQVDANSNSRTTSRSVPFPNFVRELGVRGENYFTLFFDINGDGLQDLLGYFGNHQRLSVSINVGGGQFSAPVDLIGESELQLSSYSVESPIDGPSVVTVPKYLHGLKVHDLNMDGRPELLVPGERIVTGCSDINYAGSTSSTTIQQCGEALYSETRSVGNSQSTNLIAAEQRDDGIYRFDALFFDIATSGAITARRTNTELVGSATESAFIDAFGTGQLDFVFAYGEREGVNEILVDEARGAMSGKTRGYYINRNYGAGSGLSGRDYAPVDMLIKSENGLGSIAQWRYRPLSSQDTDDTGRPYYEPDFDYLRNSSKFTGEYLNFGSSMYVVAAFDQDNGIGSLNRTNYRYEGAVYNTQGRGFQGFRVMYTEDVTRGLRTRQTFDQVFPFTGRLTGMQTFAKNSTGTWIKVAESETNWAENTSSHSDYDSVNEVKRVYAPASTERSFDLISGSTTPLTSKTVTVVSIDAFGNVTEQITTDSDNDATLTITTQNDFDYTSVSNNWINKLESSTRSFNTRYKSTSPSQALHSHISNAAQNRVIYTEYQYDLLHRLPDEQTTTAEGALERFLDVSNTPPRISDSNNRLSHKKATTYNTYGLPINIKHVGRTYDGSKDSWGTQERETTIQYTANGASVADDGYFPIEFTNALGHVTSSTVDISTGLPLTETDANGLVVTYTYDGFGRLLSSNLPGSPIQYTAYQRVDGDSNAPEHAVYKIITRQSGTPQSETYLDSQERVLRTSVESFDGNSDYFSDTQYNERGELAFESVPYQNGNSVYGTHYKAYDSLGRLTEKVMDQTNGQTLTTEYEHRDFRTIITAGTLPAMSRTYGGRGQLLMTTDAQGGVTRYAYDSMGNPVVIRDANGSDIIAEYNSLGHKLTVSDPNMGVTHFINNTFGEPELELDANGDLISYGYDALGRVTARSTEHATNTALDTRAEYIWDTKKAGLLSTEREGNMQKQYDYDSHLRLTQTTTTLDTNNVFTIKHQYDSVLGRPKAMEFPNGLTLEYLYNNQGYLTTVRNASSQYIYRNISAMDAFGNITAASMTGTRVNGQYRFAPETGQMITSNAENEEGVFHSVFYDQYDVFGNLKSARNLSAGWAETYAYDSLQRLTAYGSNLDHVNYDYDSVGNITEKSDYASTYKYGNSCGGNNNKPNAVCEVVKTNGTSVAFSYDSKGNMTGGDNLVADYYAFGKPSLITRSGKSSRFFYGSDRARYKQIADSKTTYYIEGVYEVEGNNWRAYIDDIAVINYTAAIPAQNVEEDITIRYMHRDRLGSALTLTDDKGRVSEQRRFDPFGKPVGLITPLANNTLGDFGGDYELNKRGFTDHEHLDNVELIHMSGRVYDYNLGRFLSVDPFIQAPGNSQSINPYSYIMNNPLAGMDPSGYCSVKDTVSECGDTVGAGETSAITDADGNTVGHVGKDTNGNLHFTSNGSDKGQSAVANSIASVGKPTEIGSQQNLAKQDSSSGGFVDKAKGFFKQMGQSFLDSQAQELAGGIGVQNTEDIESSIQFPMNGEELEGAELAEGMMSNVNMAAGTVAMIANLRNAELKPNKEMIMGSISLLVKDGAIDASLLSSFVPENIKNDFFPTDRVPAGQSYRFKIGDTKIHLKWHSPDLAIRQRYSSANSGRVWTAQIRVGRHYLLSNGNWSARKGIQKSNRAHIPVYQR